MPAQKFPDKHSLKTLNMDQPVGIPSNVSQQYLMQECEGAENGHNLNSRSDRLSRMTSGVTMKQWITVIILCYVNLINYMDRYTIAGRPYPLLSNPVLKVMLRPRCHSYEIFRHNAGSRPGTSLSGVGLYLCLIFKLLASNSSSTK
ncbi:hypothetical protein AAG570_000133 [Ranatra chinensis]|uniref:Uncharacterized protein n=1 Tax=Ranatra chinensis TaxID=642074 RepID=A0ABD0YW67_9HEMI